VGGLRDGLGGSGGKQAGGGAAVFVDPGDQFVEGEADFVFGEGAVAVVVDELLDEVGSGAGEVDLFLVDL